METLVTYLVIGALSGFIVNKTTEGTGHGVIGDVIVGILGTFTAGFVFGHLDPAPYGLLSPVVISLTSVLVLTKLIKK
ncbi:MAG: GlsB/YeaQ/YmgE family stress response membrane protein [Alphaproteobacteria bacterium]